MSAFSKFMKLFSMSGGVRATKNPLTGGIVVSSGGSADLASSIATLGIRPQNIGTRVENAQALSLANASGRTFHEVYSIEVGCDAVRFIFMNSQTSGTYTVGPVKCCSVANISSDQNQNGATWTNVTFAGASTVVVPNATDANNPVIAFSDWIPLSSVGRTNDPSGLNKPVILVRSYFPNTTANVTSTGPGLNHPTSGYAAPDGRVYIQRTQGAVDGVTTLANFTQTSNGGNGGTLGLQYSARGKLLQLYAFGDSITAGQKGRDPQYGWLSRLRNNISFSSAPVEVANFGWSGQTTTRFSARAAYVLPQMPVGALLYPTFSPNDNATLTQAVINTMMVNLQTVLRAAFAANITPILWTSLPYAASTATTCTNTYSTPGINTITPVSMSGISNGTPVRLDLGANQEVVMASNVTGSAFDCVTAYPHTANFAVIPLPNAVSVFGSSDSFRKALTTTLKAFPGVGVVSMESLGNGDAPERWVSTLDTYEGLHPEDSGNAKMAAIMASYLSGVRVNF
jgi:lysophospholipase L1-like esterase